jgi:peptidoglycan/LPS O-acetylase OafA/YrhL
MIIGLFISTFLIAFAVASIVVWFFKKPIDEILKRIIPGDISYAWSKYMQFAIYVVGIGGGVRIWELEKYLTAQKELNAGNVVELTTDRWILEVYGTIIGTLQSVAMLLLVFFIVALIAIVIIRIFEGRQPKTETSHRDNSVS